ncbi:MAG: TonB family protein [Bacteroidetes bacterium]|nr:TonB family protein [Bacteroidota bacterium]
MSNSGSVNQILVDEIIRVIRNSPKWESPKNPIIDEPFTSNTIVRFRLPDQILNETPYVVVEQMPMYPGGDVELLNYISKSTSYPEAAKEAKAEGRVIVRFIVTKEGNADGVSVLKGVHPLLDEEAIRVVSTLKGFEPGKQGGEPVNVWYMVPINFVLPKVAVDSVLSHSVRSEVGKNPLVVVNGVVTDKDASQIDSKIIESVHVTKGKAATDLYGEKAKDGVIHIITKKESSGGNTDPNIPFVVVEDMPEFPGGYMAMMDWLRKNINYPKEAVGQNIEGVVTVRFVVSSEGKVRETIVLKTDNQIFNNEAIRVVSSMPEWKPGSQNGKNVDVYCMIPVSFLSEQKILDDSAVLSEQEETIHSKTKSSVNNGIVPFNVIRKDGIVSTSVSKIKNTGNEVIIRYFEGEKLIPNNKYTIFGTSGKQFTIGYKAGFENVLFPFNLKLNKTNYSTGSNSRPDINFECMINEPGKWEITIKTNAEKFPMLQREEEKQIVR